MEKDTNVYVKEGRKYRPIGYWFDSRYERLTEGVWVVCNHKHSYGTTSGQYMKECYGIDKVSDLKDITFAELGGLEKIANNVADEIVDIDFGRMSKYEIVRAVLGAAYKIQKEDENNKE